MKNKTSHVVFTFILVAIIASFACFSSSAATKEGTDGNITWSVDTSTGVLTISGDGSMNNYSSGKAPWNTYKTKITSIIIEDGVTSIGNYAFANLTKATSVEIPDSVTSIGSYSFFYAGVTSITVPDSVTSIGNYAFSQCSSLLTLSIGDGVTTIPSGLCNFDTALESVTIGESVTTIKNSAFAGCVALTSIEIPDSVTTIGDSAFSYCTSLATVTIGSGLESLADFAFEECTAVTAFTVSSDNTTFTSVKGVLFSKDKTTLILYPAAKGTSYTIPSTTTTIGYGAFMDAQLESVTIPDSVTTIESYAFAYSTLVTVEIPDSVTYFGDDEGMVFANCTSLTTAIIGNGITSIPMSAFEGCTALSAITFNTTLEEIIDFAFNDCGALENVYYIGTEDEWNEVTISDADNDDLLAAEVHFICDTEVLKEATCTKSGVLAYTCIDCGYVYSTEEIPSKTAVNWKAFCEWFVGLWSFIKSLFSWCS